MKISNYLIFLLLILFSRYSYSINATPILFMNDINLYSEQFLYNNLVYLSLLISFSISILIIPVALFLIQPSKHFKI